MMTILQQASLKNLRSLIGQIADQLVWDINAIYVLNSAGGFKIEALSVEPVSPEPNNFDEVFPVTVQSLTEPVHFLPQGEPGYVYSVLAANERITGVDIVRTCIRFPSEEVMPPSEFNDAEVGMNLVDCGVIIHTTAGALAAVQFHPAFGFGGDAPFGLMSEEQAMSLPYGYEVIPLAQGTIDEHH
jgi:hypothetical protein